MQRREFITLLGGATAAWPVAARAQQSARPKRIGVLMPYAADNPDAQAGAAGFLQGLEAAGWSVGRNLRIDWRYAAVDQRDRFRALADELVALAPDVLLVTGASVRAMQQATRTIPIVFASLNDPVGGGFVASLSRPGGNTTGFASVEYGFSPKWLELLKEIAPRVTRVAVIRDPGGTGGFGYIGALQGVAPTFRVEVRPVDASDPAEIERGVAALAREPNGGLIVPPSTSAELRRDLIVSLAGRHRLPAVYFSRADVAAGGLISYGRINTDAWRHAAGYVDRIFKGEKPADLPVQAPVKYETVLNMKTAKALGLEVPPQVLVRADKVIE